MFLHRAIWILVNGEMPKAHIIHHLDGDKTNNHIENLECLSLKEHGLKHRKTNRKRTYYKNGGCKVEKIK